MGKPSLHDLWKWIRGWRLDKAFHEIKDFVEKTAVAVTESVKTATEGTIAQSIAASLDATFGTHLAETALKLLHIAAIKALAIETGIEAVPDDPSGEDLIRFEQLVFQALTGMSESSKSRIWTSYAAHLYQIIHNAINSPTPLTWAEIVAIVEKAYQDFKQAQADAEAA